MTAHQVLAQCDPSTIDPCEIGNNSIIQACYHAQIAKTSNGYSITGEDFAPSGNADQLVLTNIPSTSYPMPTDVFPVWGAIGGRTQAVFLGSDEIIYAIGEEDLIIDATNTTGTAWGATTLSLPIGISVCDVNKWEGAAGSGSDNSNNNSIATGEKDGFLVFSTISGEAYITGDGASAIQAQASNTDWTLIDMPAGVTVEDFAVGYRTLLIQGSDGNFYASGPSSYLGNGTTANLNTVTILTTQPAISIFGISQIQAGFNAFFILDGDGTIHVLGENSEGALGVGNTSAVSYWSKVGANCTSGVLENVSYISTVSTHDYRINSSAILIDGSIRSWGSNSKQSITSGDDGILSCPISPAGDNSNAVAISNGGHISPYVNTDIQICNIGHNKDGAFGDGNNDEEDYGVYTCRDIPGTPEICGTKEANLSLEKIVSNQSPNTGQDIIFTIIVTNNGPELSTGSFVRDQLTSAFQYLNDDSDGAYNSTTGLWVLGPLEVGASDSLNITVKAIEAGTQTNYAQILVDNEVDVNSTPGDNSSNQDDDDLIALEVIACPSGLSNVLLCPGDSIFIANDWVKEEGTYLETIPLEIDCDSLHFSTVLFVEEPPSPELDIDCSEKEYLLSIDGNSTWTPSWDNGAVTYQTQYDRTKNKATLTLETAPNCLEQIVIDLPPFANIDNIPIFEDTTILENTELILNAGLNPSEWQMLWSPESIFDCATCNIVNITGIENTMINLYLEHITGCAFNSSFYLRIQEEPEHLFVPNVFSPNDDGYNDVWTVYPTPNLILETCTIFGRWGNLVFQSEGGIPVWNGIIHDEPCSSGVYTYYIQYRNAEDEIFIKSGDITLVR